MKKWTYLVMLAGMGLVYLSFVDNWQVYAKPFMWLWEQCGKDILEEPVETMENPQKAEGAGEERNPDEDTGQINQKENADETVLGSGNADGENLSGGEQTEFETLNPDHAGDNAEEEQGEQQAPVSPPAYVTVEDDYFSDAVFIGDSRTVGMDEYGGLEEISTFYASTGLTVYKMFTAQIVSVPGEKKKITVEEALQQNSFAKIYLMIGINEMGTGTVDSFAAKYREVVEHLKELQPDAIIYIQGIIKVTSERSAKGDYITNEGIEARNEAIAQIADNVTVFYLDVNPCICDETGGMVPSYTFDGVHLKAKYIEIWKDFLKEHAYDVR